jgi:hypothetical protein
MAASRSVFYCFGAYVGQYTGNSSCRWWPVDPTSINFDQTKLVPSNLASNPNGFRTGALTSITQIEVDDPPGHGGSTKIGPTFPNGSMINGVWVESTHYDHFDPAYKPPRLQPTDHCRAYELTTVYYWGGPHQGHRYWGFYVEIGSEHGNNALVSIWPEGLSSAPGQGAVCSIWLDLTQQHEIEAGFTEVGVGNAPKAGALFLDATTVQQLTLTTAKRPIIYGV